MESRRTQIGWLAERRKIESGLLGCSLWECPSAAIIDLILPGPSALSSAVMYLGDVVYLLFIRPRNPLKGLGCDVAIDFRPQQQSQLGQLQSYYREKGGNSSIHGVSLIACSI